MLNKSLELINWSNEEGCRYAPPLMGSSVYTKILNLEKAIKILDKNNISIEEELEKFNFQGVKKK